MTPPVRSRRRRRLVPAVLATLGLVLVGVQAGRSAGSPPEVGADEVHPELRHLEIRRSAPAADSTVAPPSEVRIWFTEVPLYQSTTIRLLDAGGTLVPTGTTTRAPDDGRVYFVEIERRLPAGQYTVAWRTIASDGHAIADEFRFRVRTE